ncbi:MAG: hypothetical protein ACI9ZH_002537, partial [Paracoccaceae bacterium]
MRRWARLGCSAQRVTLASAGRCASSPPAPRRHRPGTENCMDQVKIFGERNTATNLLVKLIRANC